MAVSTAPFILVVEDDPGHSALIRAAFRKRLHRAKLHFVISGWEARAYLGRQSPYHDWERYPTPSLIVIDLGQPDSHAFEAIEWMAEWEWLARIPVIAFSSEDPEHEERICGLGVRRYMPKPDDYGELVATVLEELGLAPQMVSPEG